jgi:two-component system cell cycle sensor histidine kinase/response regulator CckA
MIHPCGFLDQSIMTPGNQILIVDDEPLLLKMLNAYLGRLGFDVVAVSSTEKAWAAVQAAPGSFAVAVLDATLKGIAMEDLATRMLAEDPRLRVIAVSGYPVDIVGLQAAAPDRVMFLHKPFTAEMLGNAVRRMIGTQEAGV